MSDDIPMHECVVCGHWIRDGWVHACGCTIQPATRQATLVGGSLMGGVPRVADEVIAALDAEDGVERNPEAAKSPVATKPVQVPKEGTA